jgi:NADH:ubiquinone oxidoreductase subunit 5 (subunit L)/multisubunit Na+/H+ antiporter MnhA subunit
MDRFITFGIGLNTILLASLSTIRALDIKELIAFSSVSHAAVYLIGVLSNKFQGLIGSVLLGVGHGFVSSGLFTCVGGVLFVILFFILCLGNCGAPLTLNFVGEFLSLFGVFERLPYLGLLAGISIVLSAAYTIYLFNRTAFGGVFSKFFAENISDISLRETNILLPLVLFTIILGIYPSIITDGLNYTLSTLIYEAGEISVCTLGILLKIYRGQTLKKNSISKFNFYTIKGRMSNPASLLYLISLNKLFIIDRDIVKNNLFFILSIILLSIVLSFIFYNILFNLKDIILIFATLIIFLILVQERSSTILNFSINSI